MRFCGEELKKGDNPELIKQGIYYLSEDRSGTSLFLESPIWKNIIFGTEHKHPEFMSMPKLLPLTFCIASTLLWARIAAKIANKASAVTLNRATGVVLTILGAAIVLVNLF